MAGLAAIAKASGHRVTGCDENVYPPMSTQLEAEGIDLTSGWDVSQLSIKPDLFVIGNVVSRGNPLVEEILRKNLPYVSGPQWLGENILQGRWVLGVAGTHGKTTVSSMLAWILDFAELNPGFLIGGVPENFGVTARISNSPFFVIEADEYDTAFFDKRSKFVHYKPRTVVLNNLEFDHADIFDNLKAIENQFNHLIRTIPSDGLIVSNGKDKNLKRVLKKGCWTPVEFFNQSKFGWSSREVRPGEIEVCLNGKVQGDLKILQYGEHNYANALAAISAARHAGVPLETSLLALHQFKGVKRRMEFIGEASNVQVFHDFAHHPTAIKKTLEAFRAKVGSARIIVLLEPRSNTMKMGVMKEKLVESLSGSDKVYCFRKDLQWDPEVSLRELGDKVQFFNDLDLLTKDVIHASIPGDYILIMSNGDFGGISSKLLARI